MGPGVKPRRDGAPIQEATLQAQVARLREELEMSVMKTARLQERLVATIKELDDQRIAHLRELNIERRAKETLSRKLDGYLDEVKRAERHRDDMREVVTILLEKAESCSDLSTWPSSRLELPRPLDPYVGAHVHQSYVNSIPDGRDSIHAATVMLLQKQLDTERKAHVRTKQEADAHTLRLEAMIARRDAELQACAVHDAHNALLSSAPSDVISCRTCNPANRTDGHNLHRHASAPCPGHASTARDASDNAVLARTASRNRVLEREVEMLRHTVHHAAQRSHSSEASRVRMTNVQPAEKQRVSVQVQTDYPARPERHVEDFPPSPGLLPHTMPTSPSPYNLTPQRPRTPPRTCSSLPLPSDKYTSERDGNIDHLQQDINILSLKIDDFVVERAAVKSMVTRSLPKPLSAEPLLNPVRGYMEPGLIPHEVDEWARERQELHRQLEATTRERTHREQELQAEIASLREALLENRRDQAVRSPSQPRGQEDPDYLKPAPALSPRVSPTLVLEGVRRLPTDGETDYGGAHVEAHGSRPPPIEPPLPEQGDEFGEQPMELATPLLSTTILSICPDAWPLPPTALPVNPHTSLEPEDVDPTGIPLPTSPPIFSPPAPSSPATRSPLRTPPFLTQHTPAPSSSSSSSPPLYVAPPHNDVPADLLRRIESAAQERVTSIEREIADAQRELAHREASLARLDTALRAPQQPPTRESAC